MAKLDSSLGFQDTMPFGKKHPGKTIEAIYKEDVGYLLWMRDKRKEDNGDANFFSRDVLALLDDAVRNSKSLAKNHQIWGVTLLPTEPVTEVAPQVNQQVKSAYGAEWGAF